VSDSASLAGSDRTPRASAGHETPDDPTALEDQFLAAYFAEKCLLIAGFYDGRGWFRTSVLSRVKRGVRGAFRRRNACKFGEIVATVGARRWA
jgi:hypothetical protein